MSNLNSNKTCYHCGEICARELIQFESHSFCCRGCKTVYELLNQNDLCDYYSLEKQPGISLNALHSVNKYEYLDSEEISNKLLDFKDDNLRKISLFIPTIHCSSCIWLLENLHKIQPSIVFSRVNFIKKEVYLTFNNTITLRQVVELVSSLGYEPKITAKGTEQKETKTNKTLLYKIGVAGFFGGNIMMISFPEYFGDKTFYGSEFQHFFGYINLFLSLPILFYSSSDYFTSAFSIISNKRTNIDVPISIGILAIFIRSTYEILSHSGVGYMDSMAGLVFFLLVGKWFQEKTYQALSYDRDYKSYFPVAATVIQGSNQTQIPIEKLKKDDIVRVKNNEVIPADAVLLSNKATIDYSFVTGESISINKLKNDSLFAGGKQIGAAITVKITKKVSQSYLTQLWNQQAFEQKENRQLSSIIDKVSQYFTIGIILVAFLTGLAWFFVDSSQIANAVTSVLIIACPCALALTLPFSYGNALRVFGKKELYLKAPNVVEELAKINTIVFDKTGTLTHGSANSIFFEGDNLSEKENQLVKSLVSNSSHPLSNAIFNSINANEIEIYNFNEHLGKGIEGEVDNIKIKLGSSSFVNADNNENTLDSRVYLQINNQKKGYYVIESAYRPGLDSLLQNLKQNYKIYLLSGDNQSSKGEIINLFNEKNTFFNQSPQQKLNFIERLQKKGNKVLMVGDGLNDAGALKAADVGVAITDDIYNFTPSSDAILGANQFKNLAIFLSFSKQILTIVKLSFILSFIYNIIGLFFAVQGLLSPIVAAILMPLSSISVVVFITTTINLSSTLKYDNE